MHARSAGSGDSCKPAYVMQELSAHVTAEEPSMNANAFAAPNAADSAGMRRAEDAECPGEQQVSVLG